MLKKITLFLFLFLVVGVEAFADKPLPLLSRGMQFGDVLTLWGQPTEKIEQEVKRHDIWIYKDARVVFANGLVESWFDKNALPVVDPSAVATPMPLVAAKVPETKRNEQEVVDEILHEIMKEPSTPDAPNISPPPPPAPVGNMVSPGEVAPPADFVN